MAAPYCVCLDRPSLSITIIIFTLAITIHFCERHVCAGLITQLRPTSACLSAFLHLPSLSTNVRDKLAQPHSSRSILI